MPILRSLLLLLATLTVCRSAAAQGERPAGHGTLTGVVRDSASGAPLPGMLLSFGTRPQVTFGDQDTRADASGRYVRDLSPGLHKLWVYCPNPLRLVHERRQPVRIGPDSTLILDLLVSPGACLGPTDSVDAEFVGHYVSGFEISAFIPCPGTIERVWRPLLGSRDVSVDLSEKALKTGPRRWPAPESTGLDRYFVRWKGRLAGPGAYGHLSASPYQLTVLRILEVRTPTPGDCG